MKYQTPELSSLMLAINAIQGIKSESPSDGPPFEKDSDAAYEDWE